MLRRKFLTRVGLLICAFVIGAAVAVWKLQEVQQDLDRVTADAAEVTDTIQSIAGVINGVDAYRLSPSGVDPTDLTRTSESLAKLLDTLADRPMVMGSREATSQLKELRAALPEFLVQDGDEANHAAMATHVPASIRVHAMVQELGRVMRDRIASEQARVGGSFRIMVIALTLAAFVMVNVSIWVLLRTAQMVLRPVASLVSGSRELAAERFDHRVPVDGGDEFGELAHAYNRLAEQLQSNELRRTETLRQLAVTLNHDLNNAMSIIEMQLKLLDRRSGQDPSYTNPLREIRGGLLRMSQTVSSLKNIRRVVLTDYIPGEKMIDLERSVAEHPDETTAATGGVR
jgi:signal transduction histidine kinase